MNEFNLKAKNISVNFPGVKALDNVDFEIKTGEIHALLGTNGAGKSTLMKVLAGINTNYNGEIYLNGKAVNIHNPFDAKNLGIQIVHQEVDTALVPSLSVMENILIDDLGVKKGCGIFINRNRMRKKANELLDRLNIKLDVSAKAGDLPLAQKQIILIARAIGNKCNFLLLDEPTAPLSSVETENLFELCRSLVKTHSISIVFISHRIEEVLKICNKYTIMRNGKAVDTSDVTSKTTTDEIIKKMLGGGFNYISRTYNNKFGNIAFQAENLSDFDGHVNDVSLYVRKGEIIGIAGTVGAGKSELCKILFGASKCSQGVLKRNGKIVKIHSPSDAVRYGIGLVPEERRKEGIMIFESIDFNLAAANLKKFSFMSFIRSKETERNAVEQIERLNIKTASIHQTANVLSGGNQQKTVVGKWLAADCDVYIFDEPTKGIDMRAKTDMLKVISDLAKTGHSIIYSSCENEELLSVTDRIYVLFDGKAVAELITAETCEEEIMHYAAGASAPFKLKSY